MEIMVSGLLVPLFGTSLGAVMVLLSKREMNDGLQYYLNQFAAGVMMAASVFSLLLPAIEQEKDLKRFAFLPAVCGFWLGILCLTWIQKRLPCTKIEKTGKITEACDRRMMLLLFAIVIHNIPEGMAVGAVFADWFLDAKNSTVATAFALAAGIAVQNIPEGAIISFPLHANGMGKKKACFFGILSGVIEPVSGMITIFLSGAIVPVLPYLLGFSAGAMIYVVVKELLPLAEEDRSGVFSFAVGFSLMMVLDVAFG